MKKILLIVESPAKIKTISKLLGPEFTILSTVGHIKDLPKKSLGITMDGEHVELEYVVMEKKDKVIKDLIKAAKTADLVLLASDPDREGEVIAWHVQQELEDVVKNKDSIKRITYNEITKPALQAAILNQGPVDLQKSPCSTSTSSSRPFRRIRSFSNFVESSQGLIGRSCSISCTSPYL